MNDRNRRSRSVVPITIGRRLRDTGAIWIRVGAISVVTLALSSCYVAGQGYHFLRNQARARSIESATVQSSITPEEEALFTRIESVRTYAQEEIGLAATDSYTTYIRTEREHLVDVVSAAGTLSFKRKEWWFPIVGRVPYKGYYNPKAAQRLAKRLKRRDWDVFVRPVEAFSTLGYFREPIYTFMTQYDDARLAGIVIHEMAHATLWVKGESSFNETFASFVERVGSLEYLAATYGEDSKQVRELKDLRHDRDRFREDVFALRDRLHEFYTSLPAANDITADDRRRYLAEKDRIIAAFQGEFARRYRSRYRGDQFEKFADIHINNAWIDLYRVYGTGLSDLEAYHQQRGGTLAETVTALIELMDRWEQLPRSARPEPIQYVRENTESQG